MKVLAINGSMKAKNSCTDKIIQPLLTGMRRAGAKTEIAYLADKDIKHCTGCMSCWSKTLERCVIEDDMGNMLDKMLHADLVVYGTPIYFFGATTGLMKDYLDRSLPLGVPHHLSRYWTDTKKLLVSPCAYPDFENFTLLVKLFKRAFKNTYIGEILRPAAELMRLDDFKTQYKSYCNDLEKAGEEIITDGSVSQKTQSKLNTFWLSPEKHLKMFEEKMKNIPKLA